MAGGASSHGGSHLRARACPRSWSWEVLDYLAARGYADVEEITTAQERLTFSLPQELKREMRAAAAARGLDRRERRGGPAASRSQGMRTLRLAVSALAVCVALSACGGQDGTGDTPTPTPTGAQPVTSLAQPRSGQPRGAVRPPATRWTRRGRRCPRPRSRRGGPTKSPPAGGTTLTGTVAPGVEPNCLLLDNYLLVGGPREVLKAGAKVTVTGRVQRDLLTTCQQGTPSPGRDRPPGLTVGACEG